MSHIFISYSRKNLGFAQKIVDVLAGNNLDTWIDWKSIPKGEDWEQEIYRGIEGADAFLFLLSPDAVVSEMCNKEISCAVKNGKRILPIVVRDVERGIVPDEISKRNWIFCREGQDDFDKAIEETSETIHTDYEWLKFHTELQVKALKWEHRQDASRLLRGKELHEAEQKLANAGSQKDPQPTNIQRQLILASQRDEMRRRNRTLIFSALAGFVMVVLGIYGLIQAKLANERAQIALARQLAAQAQSISGDAGPHVCQSSLLAIESLQRYPSTEASQALRRRLGQLSLPIARMTHDGFVSSVAFSSDGRLVVSGGCDYFDEPGLGYCRQEMARVWFWQPEDLIIEACRRLPRNLTLAEWHQYLGLETPYHVTCDPEMYPNAIIPEDAQAYLGGH